MDKNQKKTIKKVATWVILALVVALLALMPVLAGSSEEADGPVASILSAQADYHNMDTVLIGGGTLSSETALEITIPVAVKVTEYLVSNGDTVSKDDPIARVDRVSIMDAITQVQDTLDSLAEEIEAEAEKSAPEEVAAQVSGVVKQVYSAPGDNAADVMLEHGALAVLSLDGKMAVQISCDTSLSGGDAVQVAIEDSVVQGRVESNLSGILTVTVEDENYAMGQSVEVLTEDGHSLGFGELYIHSQWNATAYSGTIKNVRTGEGKSASSGSVLFTLNDTGNTARYHQLVNQRRDYEEQMLELFVLYQTETLTAPDDGIVSGVNEDADFMLAVEEAFGLSLLSTPFGEDDSAYSNIAVHITQISTDGNWIVNYNPNSFSITDYTSPSGYPSEMNDSGSIPVATVYAYVDGQWVQSSAGVGDILLVATGTQNGIVWAVKVGYAAVEPEEPDPPENPDEPEEPENPEDTSQPDTGEQDIPQMPTIPDGMLSGLPGGSFPGFFGAMPEEDANETYSLETVVVAAVTPVQKMSVQIRVDELDINKLYVGQSALVTVEALSGESFNATISEIGNNGISEGGNSKFTVTLTMQRTTNMLQGMSASAFITLKEHGEVLALPVAALNEKGSRTYVYTQYDVKEDALLNPVEVTVGVSDGEYAQILSGIEPGTIVYYAYYDQLPVTHEPEN